MGVEMKKLLSGLILAMIPLVLSGCGSGDFTSGTTISGVGSKGPVKGASIAIYGVTAAGQIGSTPLATTTTATDGSGSFSANLGSYTGAIFATMSGSSASYTDEATNNPAATLGATKLHAVAVITAPGPFNLAITPFTELAYEQAASLAPTDITSANTNISNLFLQGTSIISTLPANIAGTAQAVTNPDRINYSLALARFSQVLSTGSYTVQQGISRLKSEISGTTLTSPEWTAAAGALAANTTFTNNFQSGLLSAPVLIAFSPAAYSAIISQPVTITAKVTNYNGAAVATGTTVTFTASSGALSSATTTDANGKATVVLTPSAVGTTTVNASATISGVTVSTATAATVAVVRDPNDPGTVALTSSNTSVQNNQTVTLYATVGVVGGGPNHVTPGSAPNPAATVTFAITSGSGSLSSATATTDTSTGIASVTLSSTAPLTTIATNNVTVTATAVSASGTSTPVTSSPLQVAFTPDPLIPATVAVSASPSSIADDGSTASTITATVTNYVGTPLSGVPVTFTTTGGTLGSSSPVTTNSSGVAQMTLTSSSAGSGTVTASATADGVTKTGSTTVTFTAVASGTVTVLVKTTGTLPTSTLIGSISATLTYPTTKGLTIPTTVGTTANPTVSGVASSALPEFNTGTSGQVIMGVISTSGFSTGQFATIVFNYTSANKPVTGDFGIASGAVVTDPSNNTLSGISVAIQSVTVN